VGSRDCSNIPLDAEAPPAPPPAPQGYDFCDLPGAVLEHAALSQKARSGSMREADLTGADLNGAGLDGMKFDGAAMGGATAVRAAFGENASLIAALAPRLTVSETRIDGAQFGEALLDEADFHDARVGIASTTNFHSASLRGATFTGSTFESIDMSFARLEHAHLDQIRHHTGARTTLQFANLTDATLKDSDWDGDEQGEAPWRWATLCHTLMPNIPGRVSGDRDCPSFRP
jgi:hypothetical protein